MWLTLGIGAIGFAGMFAVFSYLTPTLLQVTGVGEGFIPFALAAFGIGTLPVMVPLTWAGMRIGRHLQRGGLRVAAGTLVIGAGLLTLAGPWLMQVPALHGVLSALGCRSLG